MGCNVYVFRKEYNSKTDDHGEIFWETKSWELGYELSLSGFGEHYQSVPPEILIALAKGLIEKGGEDHAEYPVQDLSELVSEIQQLSLEQREDSEWFLTLDY